MISRKKVTIAFTAFLAALTIVSVFGIRAFQHQKREPLTLLFAGDIMLGRQVGKAMLAARDPSLPFRALSKVISPADIAIGNLECVFVDTLITGTFNLDKITFPAYSNAVEGLKFAGFDCCSIANNHAMDFGTEGVRSTISVLENSGIMPLGTVSSTPVYIKKKGWTIALYSFWVSRDSLLVIDPGTGYVSYDTDHVFAEMKIARKSCDMLVLFLHWGSEYTGNPTDSQYKLVRCAVQAGADLIIGHGPHQIQKVERLGKSLIAYSLGNCVFDQKYEETKTGLLLKVILGQTGKTLNYKLIPTRIQDDTYITKVMEVEGENFF